MTHPWMDGARPDGSSRAQRARLVVVLLVALALPVAIVAVGSRPPEVQTLEMAGAVGAAAAPAPTTIQQWQASSSEAESTTTEDVTTTEAPTTSAAPVTTAAPTTAKPTTTTAKATTSTTHPSHPEAQAAAQAAPVTAAPTTAAPATTAKPVVTSPPTSGSGATAAEAAFLACVRQRESGGNYSIVSSNGMYMGAYQFYQGTWNSAANIAGRPDLVGQKPNLVAPSDQDAVALAYYRAAGAAPWGGRCP